VLRLPRLRYIQARSIEEAANAVASDGGHAMLIAGGTDLLPNLKRRQFDVSTLVSLRGIPGSDAIKGDPRAGMSIGAGATLDQVARHRAVLSGYQALAQAAGSVSTPHIRYMGTLGGNLMVDPRCNYYNQTFAWRKAVGFCLKKDGDICLVARSSPRCWAVSSSDTAPVAVAFEASVVLRGNEGTRRVRAADLYRDDGIDYTTRRRDEVISSVEFPTAHTTTSSYWKLRRRGSFDFPIVGAAVVIWWEDGVVREARAALSAVGSHPVDASSYLLPLRGLHPDESLIAEVAAAADKPARPLDNTDLSHYWRKRMTRVFIERALRDAAGFDPQAGLLSAQLKS
jgi:4-hydroxybenzoyl-CoA reductase subunit beta